MGKTYVKRTPEEKREQIKEITEKLDKQVTELFNSDTYKKYLKTMSKFHNYSFNNTLLITMQKPDASLVAGFSAWKNNFHRNVKKGEKGIKILAPAPVKKMIEQDVLDSYGNQVLDKDGNPKKEEVQITIPRFQVVTVFDYAQTEGEELPSIGVSELTLSVDSFNKLKTAIESVAPVPVEYADIDGSAKGYFSPPEQKIVIQKDMSEAQTLKTLIHETAHSLLHDTDGVRVEGIEDKDKKTRNTKEVEAESVAYTVCEYFGKYFDGLDTSEYSFGYIAGWSAGKDLKELKESMETIRKTASHIISKVEEKVLEKESIKDRLAKGEEKVAKQLAEKSIDKLNIGKRNDAVIG